MIQFETKAPPLWKRIPLYVQIVLALILAAELGILLSTGQPSPSHTALINNLAIPSNLVLKALRALATPLIFLAILHAFLTTEIPGKVSKIAITYVNAYNNDGLGHNTGSLASNLGGRKVSSNSIGIETNIKVKDSFFVGGWVGYSNARALTGEVKGNADVWNWAITLAFPNVKKGNLGGVIIGMQPKLTGTSAPLSGLPRHDPDTGFHIEGFYRYKINNRISITPGFIWLTAPNHNHQNGEVFEGVVRTTFDL